MNESPLELVIDEVVLYGATAIDRERFREQVERELQRILEQEGEVSPASAAGVLSTPQVSLSSAQAPDPAELARVIHEAMSR